MNPMKIKSVITLLKVISLGSALLLSLSSCSSSGNSAQYPGGFVVDQTGFSYLPPKARFRKAISNDDFKEAAKWARPSYVNQPIDGQIPVAKAVLKGHHNEALRMAEKGADLSLRTNQGESLAMVAAMAGHHEQALKMAQRGASVTDRTPKGQSLAYYAASHGKPGIARQYAALGGGASSDLSRGASKWAAGAAERRRYQQRSQQIMWGLIGLAAESMRSGSQTSSTYEEDLRRAQMGQGLPAHAR